MAATYDKNRDYSAEISKAVAAGDYSTAAQLEQQRNAKIAGEGMNYAQTNNYSQYLPAATPKVSMDQNIMSAEDWDLAQKYTQQWKDAKAAGNQGAMDAAHDLMEQLRAQYGYSGGADGSKYIKLQTDDNAYLKEMLQQLLNGSMNTPSYGGNKNYDLAQAITDKLSSMQYEDWTKTDQYKSLADRYGYQGELSMQDMLAQISSRTGGLASSYATTAAQQQYNEYMAMLEDVARKQYAGDRADLMENAQMALDLGDRDYQRYLDGLSQGNANRSYAMQVIGELLGYNTQQDQTQYDRGQTAMGQAQNRIYDYLVNMGGNYGDLPADLITQSGYTTAELERMQAMYQAALAKGSGGGGGPSSNPDSKTADKKYMPAGWNILEAQQIKDEAGGSVLTDKAWNAIKEAYGVGDNDIAAYGFTKVDSNLGYTGPESLLNLYPGNNGKALTDAEKKLLGLKTGGTSTR